MGKLRHLPEGQLLKMISEEPELTIKEYSDFLKEIQDPPICKDGRNEYSKSEALRIADRILNDGIIDVAKDLGVGVQFLKARFRRWKSYGWI